MNALPADLQPHHIPDAPDPPRFKDWRADHPEAFLRLLQDTLGDEWEEAVVNLLYGRMGGMWEAHYRGKLEECFERRWVDGTLPKDEAGVEMRKR